MHLLFLVFWKLERQDFDVRMLIANYFLLKAEVKKSRAGILHFCLLCLYTKSFN